MADRRDVVELRYWACTLSYDPAKGLIATIVSFVVVAFFTIFVTHGPFVSPSQYNKLAHTL